MLSVVSVYCEVVDGVWRVAGQCGGSEPARGECNGWGDCGQGPTETLTKGERCQGPDGNDVCERKKQEETDRSRKASRTSTVNAVTVTVITIFPSNSTQKYLVTSFG